MEMQAFCKNKVKIQRVSANDNDILVKISDNMRDIDVKECIGVGFHNQYQALLESVNASTNAYAVFYDDVPMGAFGINTKRDDLGCMIWFLGVKGLEKHKKQFLTISKIILELWQKEYGQLYNFVSAENENCIKWLTWLGAVVHDAEKLSCTDEDFCLFILGGE